MDLAFESDLQGLLKKVEDLEYRLHQVENPGFGLRVALINPAAKLPSYGTFGSVGLDLQTMQDIMLAPGESLRVKTGVAIDLLDGHEAQLRPRSGVSGKGALIHFGTVDTDYTGELMLNITNVGKQSYEASNGERIAQMVIARAIRVSVEQVDYATFKKTERGDKGFGSTGK